MGQEPQKGKKILPCGGWVHPVGFRDGAGRCDIFYTLNGFKVAPCLFPQMLRPALKKFDSENRFLMYRKCHLAGYFNRFSMLLYRFEVQ